MEKENKGLIGFRGWLEIRDNKTRALLLVTPNTIVNRGLKSVANMLGNAAAPVLAKAWVGSGSTAVTNDDEAMEAPLGTAITPTFSLITTSVTNDTAQFVSVHTAGAGGWAVREYGIFTSDDIMFNHVVFSVINLAESNELEFTYKVQIQRVV